MRRRLLGLLLSSTADVISESLGVLVTESADDGGERNKKSLPTKKNLSGRWITDDVMR